MRVGKSRKDLTPYGRKFYLLGYKNPKRNQPAEGIHDPIYSNSLLIEEGTIRVFFVERRFIRTSRCGCNRH